MTNPLIEQPLSPEQLEELRDLHGKASGGTWSSDLHGLYITTDECPLCTPKQNAEKRKQVQNGVMGFMLADNPAVGGFEPEDEAEGIIRMRGWGHLQYHGEDEGSAVQHANADLIAAMRNNLPQLLSMAERCVVLEDLLKHELEAGLRVCNSAIMPNDVIESIREEWGNTNVAVYKHNSDAAREEIKKLLPPFPNTGETAA